MLRQLQKCLGKSNAALVATAILLLLQPAFAGEEPVSGTARGAALSLIKPPLAAAPASVHPAPPCKPATGAQPPLTPPARMSPAPHPAAQAGQQTTTPAAPEALEPACKQPAASEEGCSIISDKGKPVYPSAVALVGDDLYFLEPGTLWRAQGEFSKLSKAQPIKVCACGPAHPSIANIPVQEMSLLTFAPERAALQILDKTGDIFEYSPAKNAWSVLRPNYPLGSPDPEYIDMAAAGKNVCLLDPERNQIWRYPAAGVSPRYFKEVLPWRVKPGDVYLGDAIGIGYDGTTWVLRRNGKIARFVQDGPTVLAHPVPFAWKPPRGLRPSRIYTADGAPLYIVERENNRVLAIDKTTAKARPFVFSGSSDLRDLLPVNGGFWVINRDHLVFRDLSKPDPSGTKITPRHIDHRLSGLSMPLRGATLPRHPGVWPGARRLYRYGVHHGTDFFNDPAGKTYIEMGTPVYAADDGKIIRCDANFKDMDATKYSYVIYQCHHRHITSEANEDLLRGCQVWVDHGGGLVTKYAHLDKIKPGLKAGAKVTRGDLIGYVGVSGTGENLEGRVKHPHLHFEIWLDGKYLGWGLTPPETIGVYEDVFGLANKRGAHE